VLNLEISLKVTPSLDNFSIYYYRYSAFRPVWAETRAQSGDWYGPGRLHPRQILRGSLPLLSPAFRRYHFRHRVQFINIFHYYVLSSTYHISLSFVWKFTGVRRWKLHNECYDTDWPTTTKNWPSLRRASKIFTLYFTGSFICPTAITNSRYIKKHRLRSFGSQDGRTDQSVSSLNPENRGNCCVA
jgi:hypothetical protein